ncbi:MAG: serine hydrolase domain-containing protein [Pseudomonadota bacterium]
MSVRHFLCYAIGVLFTFSVQADDEPTNEAELLARVEAILNEGGVPGMALALVEGHDVSLVTGVGLARTEPSVPMTADTLVRVGSLSKNLTTLAALRLVEEGKLDLDARIGDVAPEVALNNPWSDTHPVTLRHLLSHTAGLEGSTYHEYADSRPNVAPRDYAREFSGHVAVRWPPGQFYSYANPGHTLAAVAIEAACKCAFDDYLEQSVFEPLGMSTSTFRHDENHEQTIAYSYTEGGERISKSWLMPIRPSGSMVSTATDLSKLLLFYAAPRTGEARMVSDELLATMETDQPSLSGARGVQMSGYGLGSTSFSPGNGILLHGHLGSTEGFKTWLGYVPGAGAGYAFVINADNDRVRRRLAYVLGRYVSRRLSTASDTASDRLAVAGNPVPESALGWYAPFTHNMVLRSGLVNILGVVKMVASDDGVRLEPLLPNLSPASLQSKDGVTFYAGQHPVPVAALVEDHEGRTRFVRRSGFEPVSAARAIGRPVLLIGATVLAIVVVVTLGLRAVLARFTRVRGLTRRNVTLWLSAAAWVAILVLFVRHGLLGATDDLHAMGTVSAVSLTLLALSVLGPVMALGALLPSAAATAGWRRNLHIVIALVLASGWVLLGVNGFVPLVTFSP